VTEAPLTERRIQRAIFHARHSQCRIALPNFTPRGWHECDVWLVTKAGYAHEYEIKLTAADFRADRQKLESAWRWKQGEWWKRQTRTKHERLAAGDTAGPVQFWYVAPEGVLTPDMMPPWAGLIEVHPFGRSGTLLPRTRGPRLHKERVPDAVLQQATTACYWRFWHERNLLDDLREAETARD